MDSATEILDRILAWLLLPATLYGAGGALMHAGRKKQPVRKTIVELTGGAITANMVCPLVQHYTPEQMHYTLFFLVGWGGLELVGRLYEAIAAALEARIRRRLGEGEGREN
ncbi:hypothetical protein LJC59_00220 [Desulfovibrio sp. OttesenSCG-928-A18]|nr:hypothetical protein [Desulfovibrio sp. OttesenSCG-928-A18]